MAAEAAARNPLREGLVVESRIPEPTTVVIFGASGDLTHRKLVPALYSLARDRLMPPRFAIVGVARRPRSDDEFRAELRQSCDTHARRRPVDPQLWRSFAEGSFYHSGDFDAAATYTSLGERLEEIERLRGLPSNRVYYLATQPSQFAHVVEKLGAAKLAQQEEGRFYRRVIIEKPFGTDVESARRLNEQVRAVLRERQIYRIDHYLGKETVQNMLVFRFANGIFEPLWNSRFVDHVQITGAESIGVEGRGAYFEEAGSLRDMVQNHLLQVVALTAMEPPIAFEANAVRDEKLKVLRALRPLPTDRLGEYVTRAQYGPGMVLGQRVPGYREEPGVDPQSRSETYVALKFFIDSWRWAGVPFYLRSAKRMPKRVTEIAIYFKAAPLPLFAQAGPDAVRPNVLAVRIQPDEGISLHFGSKAPGASVQIAPVTMEFRYGSAFGVDPPEAYERLILDCMLGDGTLFTRGDEVEASWAWITRIHEAWAGEKRRELPTYEAGSWGPPEADELLARDGRGWRRP